MADNVNTIAVFMSPIQANLAKSRLEAEGISCELFGEHGYNVVGGMFGTRIRVAVSPAECERAMDILRDLEAQTRLEGEAPDTAGLRAPDEPQGFDDLVAFEQADTAPPPENGVRGPVLMVLTIGLLLLLLYYL